MRKKLGWLLIGILLLILCLLFLWQRPLISVPYQLSETITAESDIIVTDVFYDVENVSDFIDHAALLDVLSGVTCRFAPWIQTASSPMADAWEINLIQGGHPVHIVVGQQSYCYQSTGSLLVFQIMDSDFLQEELNRLLHVS